MALELERPEWHARAACRGAMDIYFPENDVYDENTRWVIARICERCPVATECLVAGVDEEYGVWGGDIREPV